MKLSKDARESLNILGDELSELMGAWSEIYGYIPERQSMFLTSCIENCLYFYKQFIMKADHKIWDMAEDHFNLAMETMQNSKEADGSKVSIRPVPLKVDVDCKGCRSCCDCDLEVTWGKEWYPVCRECAQWYLTGEERGE